ncbi:MAG: hypothetical protein COW30_02015 [Rhodospirillales bacterium CG15_BIG_FIL_POST_REV_8_21_14_020_66_15]|nr:MAG: hypothetical protein COW30_02015 [Rhodospirillales bacterium CG15_BIG_FIL_POST_REV_8_21_14_020_66_15]
MGGIFSAPKLPPAPPPPPPPPEPEDEERQRRLERLDRQRRGRAGLIATSRRGLLDQRTDGDGTGRAGAKTKLGE